MCSYHLVEAETVALPLALPLVVPPTETEPQVALTPGKSPNNLSLALMKQRIHNEPTTLALPLVVPPTETEPRVSTPGKSPNNLSLALMKQRIHNEPTTYSEGTFIILIN